MLAWPLSLLCTELSSHSCSMEWLFWKNSQNLQENMLEKLLKKALYHSYFLPNFLEAAPENVSALYFLNNIRF